MNLGPVPRAARAALFALVCAGVGAVMHQAADGCTVRWTGIALGFALVLPAGYLLLGAERSGLALTGALGTSQLGLHLLFSHFCTAMAGASAANAAAQAWERTVEQQISVSMPGTMSGTVRLPMAGMGGAGPADAATAHMIAAHLLAVLVTGWWLRQGERGLFALLAFVGHVCGNPLRRLTAALAAVRDALRTTAPPGPARVAPARMGGFVPRPEPLIRSVGFRGPPFGPAALTS